MGLAGGAMAKNATVSRLPQAHIPRGTTPRTPRCPRWRADGRVCADSSFVSLPFEHAFTDQGLKGGWQDPE